MAQPYVDCASRLAGRGITAEEIDEIICEVAEGTVHRLWEPLAAKQRRPMATPRSSVRPTASPPDSSGATSGSPRSPSRGAGSAPARARGKNSLCRRSREPLSASFTGHLRARLDGGMSRSGNRYMRGGGQEPLSAPTSRASSTPTPAFGGWPEARIDDGAGRGRSALRWRSSISRCCGADGCRVGKAKRASSTFQSFTAPLCTFARGHASLCPPYALRSVRRAAPASAVVAGMPAAVPPSTAS